MKKTMIVCSVLFIVCGASYAAGEQTPSASDDKVHSIKLPAFSVHLKPGGGLDKVSTLCGICHSTDYITMQPVFPRSTWSAEVNKMIKVMGAPISDEDARIIIDYLSTQYGTGK